MSKPLLYSTVFMGILALPAVASAATPKTAEPAHVKWSVLTGLGYDSNAYEAPGSAYVDLSVAGNPTVNPKIKSGFFVPYEARADVEKSTSQDNTLTGSASIDGRLYLGGLDNANETNIAFKGGIENVLRRNGKSKDTLYIGGVIEQHDKTYVDHDSGVEKTTTVSGRDVSGLYDYTRVGVEAEYKNRTGGVDFGLIGKYLVNDYKAQTGMPQQDHTYLRVGGDVDFQLATRTKLNLAYNHTVRDYSYRHARDLAANFTPTLLEYSFDTISAELRNRISADWVLYVDLDHIQRTDNNVGYGDYDENRYGVRVLYDKDKIKSRLSLHQWSRDYPNGFAFDVPAGGAKKYDGMDFKFKGELEQSKNSSLWAELKHEIQNSTDLRYDFTRTMLMAGMSWSY